MNGLLLMLLNVAIVHSSTCLLADSCSSLGLNVYGAFQVPLHSFETGPTTSSALPIEC